MTKRATVDVVIYDDETGSVEERLHFPESSQYAWEVEAKFERIGEAVARKVDPEYFKEQR